MSWRGESWADIVARASSTARVARSVVERDDPVELAARAQPWTFTSARVVIAPEGIVLGRGMETVEIAFAHLYHVEPVDPWPALALGWVDRGAPCSTVLTPTDDEAPTFAERVEELVETCRQKVPRATVPGWLEIAEVPWERTDALPGEREGPETQGYRVAPEAPDPILATRSIAAGGPRLLTYVIARVRRPPRRIEPRQIILTRRFVYVRTAEGTTLRVPASTLRAARRTADGDAIYVFGRNTELFLVHRDGCELSARLDERLAT